MLKPYLAFDIGAGSGRAMLGFLEKGRLEVSEIHRFSNKPVLVNGALRWDLLYIWDNFLEALKKCTSLGHRHLRAIGIDAWNVDFGLLDASGELLYNPVSYRSPVRSQVIEGIRALIDEQTLYSLTGIGYMPTTGLARLLQLRTDHPNLFSGQACSYLPLPDLFRFFLTGKRNIEDTILWGTQLADIRTRELSWQLLDLFDLPPDLFPSRIPSGRVIGGVLPEIEGSTGIGSVPVVSVAGHDTISALVSAAGMREEVALLCTGTWFILGKLLQTPVTEPIILQNGFLNEIAIGGLTYLARNMMGFYIMEGLLNAWKMSYERMIQSARESPEFALDIDINDPSFFSTTNPSQTIEEYINKTRQKTPGGRGPVVRALLEGLAFSCRDALRGLELLTGAKVAKIMLLGGAARNPLLCQMIADASSRVLVAGPAEATAVGNLGMQMIACGDVDSLSGIHDIVTHSFSMPTYEPAAPDKWDAHAGRIAGRGN